MRFPDLSCPAVLFSAESSLLSQLQGKMSSTSALSLNSKELPLLSDEQEYLTGPRARTATLSRSRYDLRTALASFLVIVIAIGAITCSLLLAILDDDDVTSSDATLVGFQMLHLISFLIIFAGTAWLLGRTWRSVFSLSRSSFGWGAAVTVGLLLLVGGSNILFNIIQLSQPAQGVGGLKVAESIWTVIESIAITALLASLELVGKQHKHHFRRAKIIILPAIIGVSLSAIVLNIVGVDTRANNPTDFTNKAEVAIVLSATFRAGALLLASEHFLKAVHDVIRSPNRHVHPSQLDGPLDSGSGQYRQILLGARHEREDSRSSSGLEDSEAALAAAVAVPVVAETVKLNAQQAARDVVVAIMQAAAARAALLGRRPLVSLLGITTSLVLFIALLPAVFVGPNDSALVVIAESSMILQGILNIAAFVVFVTFAARPNQCKPLEVPNALAKDLPGVTAIIRALLPSLGAALFLSLREWHFTEYPTRAAEGIVLITSTLAQGSVNAFLLANAPLAIVLDDAVEEEQSRPPSGPLAGSAVASVIESNPGFDAVLNANSRPLDSATGKPLTAAQIKQSDRIQSTIQLISVLNLGLNLSCLLLPLVPGIEEFDEQLRRFPISLAARAIAAFWFAFSGGVALSATRNFSILTRPERELQQQALRIMYAPIVSAEARLLVAGSFAAAGSGSGGGDPLAAPPGIFLASSSSSSAGPRSPHGHASSHSIPSDADADNDDAIAAVMERGSLRKKSPLPRGVTAELVMAAAANASNAARSSRGNTSVVAASDLHKLDLTRQASAQGLQQKAAPILHRAISAGGTGGVVIVAGSLPDESRAFSTDSTAGRPEMMMAMARSSAVATGGVAVSSDGLVGPAGGGGCERESSTRSIDVAGASEALPPGFGVDGRSTSTASLLNVELGL